MKRYPSRYGDESVATLEKWTGSGRLPAGTRKPRVGEADTRDGCSPGCRGERREHLMTLDDEPEIVCPGSWIETDDGFVSVLDPLSFDALYGEAREIGVGVRVTCGVPCPRHEHACARSVGHCGDGHRDAKQKGTETCGWGSDA